jgi:hypothetical protein
MSEATTIPSFNPSGDPRVDAIKSKTEELMKMSREYSPRCKSLAIINSEQAAMWESLFVGRDK